MSGSRKHPTSSFSRHNPHSATGFIQSPTVGFSPRLHSLHRSAMRLRTQDFLHVGNYLTPHPGPLPVEGRGGATNGFGSNVALHRVRCVPVVQTDPSEAKRTRRRATRFRRVPTRLPLPQERERGGRFSNFVKAAPRSMPFQQQEASDSSMASNGSPSPGDGPR